MSKRHLETALFVADSHFHTGPDAAERKRVEAFCALLESAHRADDLVLLGDIFDFWIDYPHFRMRGYENILAALDAVREAGCRLHFIGGNHDIWAAGYFHERYGTSPTGVAETVRLGGVRVRLDHGDGMLGRDLAYAIFRKVVRHPAGIWLGKSLHPEVLYRISTWLSKQSRSATRDEAEGIEKRARRWLERDRDDSWDLKVIGHVHHPFVCRHEGRTLSCLGDWIGGFHYGLLRDGEFQLRDFTASSPDFDTD